MNTGNAPTVAPTTGRTKALKGHLLAGAALTALCFGLFWGAVTGAFIYDDTRQVLDNPLVLVEGREWKALTSGVWAFADPAEQLLSNYWRPVYTGWTIANVRLFGVAETTPWHIANIALHAVAAFLAYLFVRRLGFHPLVAFAGAAVFAVHPTRVESVAWISGAPDPLLAIGVLGSLSCVTGLARKPGSAALWIGAVLFYLLAQGAKEAAIVHFALVGVVAWAMAPHEMPGRGRCRRAALIALPFALLGGVYFVVRARLLGSVAETLDGAPRPIETLLTAPSIGAFYLQQAAAPGASMALSPSYPLRAVTTDALSAGNFFVPLAIVLVVGLAMLWLAIRRPIGAIGLALFALPLAPSLNIGVFHPDRIVQDRYLYLPLLGLVIMFAEACRWWAQRRQRGRSEHAGALATGGALLLGAIALMVVTTAYVPVWTSEAALWTRAVRTDPGSAMNWALLGNARLAAGDTPGAREALDRALEIGPVTSALLDRAELALAEGRPLDAEPDLRRVLANFPDNPRAWEFLADALAMQNRVDEAIEALREGRERTNGYRAGFTSKLAVFLYHAGRKAEIEQELVAVRAVAGVEGTPAAAMAVFHLANLYEEQNRPADAEAAFRDYLEISNGFGDPPTVSARAHAQSRLRAMGR